MLLLACAQPSHQKAGKPSIDRQTMVKLMADLQVVAAMANHRESRKFSLQAKAMELHDSVLAAYGVSRANFDQSLTCYVHDLDSLEVMYDEAMAIVTSQLAAERTGAVDTAQVPKEETEIDQLMRAQIMQMSVKDREKRLQKIKESIRD